MRSQFNKRLTQNWLNDQGFVGVGYHGNDCPNLWEVLDLYVELNVEMLPFEDSFKAVFPEHFEDIEIVAIREEASPAIHKAIKYFDDCQNKLVFVAGELMEQKITTDG